MNEEVKPKITLHYAVNKNDPKLVSDLIRDGANVNETDENGRTPLHYAAIWFEPVIVGSPTDLKNFPAGHAKVFPVGHAKDVAKILIDNGADVHKKDSNGKTPLDLAKDQRKDGGYSEMIKFLEKNDAK